LQSFILMLLFWLLICLLNTVECDYFQSNFTIYRSQQNLSSSFRFQYCIFSSIQVSGLTGGAISFDLDSGLTIIIMWEIHFCSLLWILSLTWSQYLHHWLINVTLLIINITLLLQEGTCLFFWILRTNFRFWCDYFEQMFLLDILDILPLNRKLIWI
jgi:hypothetical protein